VNRVDRTRISAKGAEMEGEQADPKVSVCVVTYNQVNYINECLQSLVDQETTFPIEIIVADDCSTDGTAEAVREFARRYPGIVRPLLRSANLGWMRNYLEVHAEARGEYVAHMDGDDCALPGKLQAQVDALDGDHDCNAVWHLMDFFDDKGAFCSGRTADMSSFPGGRVEFRDGARLGYIGIHSSLMYRRSARSAEIDFDRPALDMRMMLELLSTGHGLILETVLGRYRVASLGSVLAASLSRVQKVAIDHAGEFMTRYPKHRPDFMIWALSSALIAAKNRQVIAFAYLRFAWQARSWVSPRVIVAHLLRVRRARMKWRSQRDICRPNAVQEI
jgi:glycosyltransferase involved in cell wall biosynthesis